MARPRIVGTEKNTYGLPQGEAIRRKLRSFFAGQRKAILRWLATGELKSDSLVDGNDVLPHYVRRRVLDGLEVSLGLHRGHAGAGTKAGPGAIPAAFPPWEDFGLGTIDLADRIVPLLKVIWDDALQAFAPRVGLDPDSFKVDSPHIEEAIRDAALAFSESTNETTSLALDEALRKTREAILAGSTGETLSYRDLTKAINEIFTTATVSRARRIAVTETSRAVHQSQELAAKKSGVVTGWKWLLSSDACPLCQTIARRAPFVRLGQSFAVIGDDPNYSTIKFPPAHPHCQCSMVEVLDIDDQPEWSATLDQPVPEEEDIATQDLIPVANRRKAMTSLPTPKKLPRVQLKHKPQA